MEKVLGTGYAAEVRLAFHTKSCRIAAAKVIRKANLSADEHVNTRTEIEILQRVQHPHLNALIQWTEDSSFYFLFLEYCAGGDMYSLLDKCEMLKEAGARMYFRQILDGVQHLHRNGVVHRDLKLENVYLDEEWRNCYVGDFGLSAAIPARSGGLFERGCGSPLYAAPEIVSCQAYEGIRADIWSLGVLLYTLVTGCMPFFSEENNTAQVFHKILRAQVFFPDHLTQECRDLLQRMLVKDPHERIVTEAIWQHAWMLQVDRLELGNPSSADLVRRHLGLAVPPHQRAVSAASRSRMRIAPK